MSDSRTSLSVGGEKGHVRETISGTILSLYDAYRWKPIPRCTGRYTCRDHSRVSRLAPMELLQEAGIQNSGGEWQQYKFCLAGKVDEVIVIPLDPTRTTGVITYVKRAADASRRPDATSADISFVHTLNTPSGFQRKLEALGIDMAEFNEPDPK